MSSRFVLLASLVVALASTPVIAASVTTSPPRRVTRVLVRKHEHVLLLLAAGRSGEEDVLRRYRVAIGPGGPGPKLKEGDMTTPVGRYHVVSHEPSKFRMFLRLDYPAAADYRRFHLAKERGELPSSATIGGDIGIHGPPVSLTEEARAGMKSRDWTAGCIAVDDDEITEIARLVRDGTVVDIEP